MPRQQDDNYYTRKQVAEEESGQLRFNVEEAMKERLKQPRVLGSGDISGQLASQSASRQFGPGYEEISASTTNPARPRALACGYNKQTQTLVIVFRPPTVISKTGNSIATSEPVWCVYDEIPEQMWEDLKNTDSTGKYLKYSGIDDLPYRRFKTASSGYAALPRKPKDNFEVGLNQGR